MKNNKLMIRINKPVGKVFAFTINPQNTPKWIDSIVTEQTNEWPIKVGSIYKNQSKDGKWSGYTVSEYIENERFIFTKNDNNYHVRYIFTPKGENDTELEYFEWIDKGNLEEPFTLKTLKKLKSVLEK